MGEMGISACAARPLRPALTSRCLYQSDDRANVAPAHQPMSKFHRLIYSLGGCREAGCASRASWRARVQGLLVLLHAFESLFKLGDQRSFTVLETVASHDAPQKIADRFLMSVIHGHQIFGRPARH
jgi:hypothetical protein